MTGVALFPLTAATSPTRSLSNTLPGQIWSYYAPCPDQVILITPHFASRDDMSCACVIQFRIYQYTPW